MAMAMGLSHRPQPHPGPQRDKEPRHLGAGGDRFPTENTTSGKEEWITSAAFLLVTLLSTTTIGSYPRQEVPYRFLGRLDAPAFRSEGVTLAYTPVTNTTRKIMSKVASGSVMAGVTIEEVENEEELEVRGFSQEEIIGVVFKDDFSYCLRFQGYSVVSPNDAYGDMDICYDYSSVYCKVPSYWYNGFLPVQSSIDAAIIEVKTNHSVWEEMKSISGVRLESPSIKLVYKRDYIWFIMYTMLCFSPFMYFLSVKVIKEKKKLKVLMRAMGLHDISFWLSWSLPYTVYVAITASLLAVIKNEEVIHEHNVFKEFLFYFFYGIASIHFFFMLGSLVKQPKIAAFVGFVLHIIFGLLGLLTLFEKVPRSLEWIFNLFSPFAFTAGISKMVKLHKYGPDSTPELYPFLNLYIILTLDSVLYLLLAIYFDKVLPGKYGAAYPPFFFLSPSYWFKPRSGYAGIGAGRMGSHGPILSNNTEPVPPDFHGKEAIRLNNVTKIYKKDKLTEGLREDMEGIQALVGFCPQFNLHFELLTVKENLRTFAHIKGIQWKEVEQEVQKVLVMLDLTDLQDVCANTLSGGQKRKLSLGIAILGNPQVLLLDEPTAGLDPCSRHHVWNLLKERQAGRVTLFTTQSMEEADAHADRKAFLSNGRLQCVGSSLYLKRKWGIGYHLRMHINDLCDPELTSSLVRQYIPNAVLKRQKGDELCYTLPLENTNSFPDLFSHLESSLLQGIVSYEVNRTTLEDVFLKLEGKEAIGHEEDVDLDGRDQSLPGFSELGSTAVTGMALWRQQVCAMMRIRFLKLKHEGKFLASILLFFGMFILPLLMIFIDIKLWNDSGNWEISASPYFLPTKVKIQNKSTNLLIFNDTGSEIEDFIAALKAQNINPEISFEKNVTSIPLYNGAIKISLEGKSYRYTVLCSVEPINCLPVLMNILSNTFLRLFNSTAPIRVWSDPFYRTGSPYTKESLFTFCLTYVLTLAAGLPPHFAMSAMEDYKLQARSQLRLAGLYPSAYWCGQALVDVPLFWTLMCLMFGVILLFNPIFPLESWTVPPLIICLIGYGVSVILFVYLIAFKFRTGRSNRYIWSFIFILVNSIVFMVSNIHTATYFTFSTLIPVFAPLAWMIFAVHNFPLYFVGHFERRGEIFISAFAPYIQCVIFAFLLRCLALRSGEAVTRLDPIFRIQQRRAVARQNRDPPGEEPPEVQAERERVRSAMASLQHQEEPVIMVNGLHKEYDDKKGCCVFKKKKKVAIKNLSFSVKKGEVLGLLGPNGAGKSTTINMISGDITVTAGENVYVSPWFLSTLTAVLANRNGHFNAFLSISHSLARALDLQKHLETPARRLSAGEARKLSFALSVLGDPTVMVWDEPSVGMDPKGQRQMWRLIRRAAQGRERAAVLCTQYLEEAAAICDRVAILVAGQLRYIGSLEDLKSKFGTSYRLEVKMRDAEHSNALHAEIVRLFPGAAWQERTTHLLIYKIPTEDVLPLSQSFSKLEAAKQNFGLEEYSLSLHTLQQMFIDLTRELQEQDLDAAPDGAMEQRPLHV
ncbi:hypothetical protein Q9233_007372 [Columba guinea]|nr:hypothetical protein Q9233_007372 [Columba guinea]